MRRKHSNSFGPFPSQGASGFRELRLSEAELEFIAARYPNARTKPLEARTYPDGKLWFEVSL